MLIRDEKESDRDALCAVDVSAFLGPVEFRPSFNDYDSVTDRGIVEQLIDDNALAVTSNVVDAIRMHFVERVNDHINTVSV